MNSSGIQHALNAVSVLLQMIYAALHLSVQWPWSVRSEMDVVTASVQCPHAQSGATPTTSPLMGLWPTFRYKLVNCGFLQTITLTVVLFPSRQIKQTKKVYSKDGYWF